MNVELVLQTRAVIGESPTWVAAENALYWIDVKKPALYCLNLASGATKEWIVSSDIGAFCLVHGEDAAVVALRDGLHRLNLASGSLNLLAAAPFDPNLFRFNDGTCDSSGRFWVGAMFDPLVKTSHSEKASLQSFTLKDGFRVEPDAAELHNGMAWAPDESAFYLSHSQKNEIFRFHYNAQSGRISNRTTFARVDPKDGVPDGAAVDRDGAYWCALHGGGKIRRYLPSGEIDRELALPVSQPTMCAFVGDKLDQLYITSAADQLSPEQLSKEPLAGSLFRVKVDVPGTVRHFTVR